MEYNFITKKEYVYVLSNPSFDNNIFKIGWSRKHPIIRANNLYTSGVPTPFVIEFVISTDDGIKLENKIHNHLEQFRINKKREFFKITKEQIYTIIKDDLNLELLNNNNIEFQNEIKNKKVDSINRFETTNKTNFKCENCNYLTINRFDYNKHCQTIKHINNLNSISEDNFHIKNDCQLEKPKFICEKCNKIYKDNSGLWKHKKQCKEINNNINCSTSTEKLKNQITPELILSVLQENNQLLSNLVVEQNNTIMELSKNG
jgi:hypothetical protein